MMHSHNNHNNDHRLPPPPQRTQRAFHVNPSPHEIAVGSVEQWRRSKLSKAWKTVLISLVKQQNRGVVLCVWRDNISVDGTSNVLEVLQKITMADVDSVNLHDRDSFSLSLLTTNLEESQVVTFRCLDEPDATKDWVTTLRTVYSHISEKKQQQYAAAGGGYPAPPKPAEVDLLSFDSPPPAPVQQSWEQQLLGQPQQQPHQKYPQHMQQRQLYPQQQHQYGQPNRQQTKGQVPAHFYPQSRHPSQQNTVYNNNNGGSNNDWTKAFVQNPPQQQQRYPHQQPLYNNRAVTPPPRTAPPSVPRPANTNSRQHSNQSHPQQQKQRPPMPPHGTPQRSFSAPLKTQTAAQRHDQIKKQILVEWALAPPALQQLRPLSQLIRSIHIVMPPRFTAVANHSYFYKWTPPPAAIGGVNSQEDAKILRKLKFFLHPDKLPKQNGGKNDSFSEDQAFLCKLLWDIIQDATAVADGT